METEIEQMDEEIPQVADSPNGNDLMEQMWRVWKEYVDFSVVENNSLKRIIFHTVLGTILTHAGYHYIESAEKKTTRLHVFMIQDSGTGKSQIMKATSNLINYLEIPARYTTKDNEASLTGTIIWDKKRRKALIKKGLLSKLFMMSWDEGSVLLKSSAFMDILTDFFQSVMDEPGTVSKGMKLGTIDYKSPCTILAGSYYFDAFRRTIIEKGFLQRMFIHFRVFSDQEEKNLRIGVGQLKARQDPRRLQELKLTFKALTLKIPSLPNGEIGFNPIAVMQFNEDMEQIYQQYIVYQFVGEKEKILKTFFNRLHVLIDKIASQRAIINGKSEVDMDDLQYAKQMIQPHIISLLRLFEYLYAGKTINAIQQREQVIIREIKTASVTGTCTQSELLAKLKELKELGRWDLGYNRSREVLNELVSQKKIIAIEGPHNAKIYHVG